MKVITIATDAAINFADCNPTSKDIILDVFNRIFQHENVTDGNPDDFEVCYSAGGLDGGQAFITSKYGTHYVHDIREEQIASSNNEENLCSVIFYSLTKILEENKNK